MPSTTPGPLPARVYRRRRLAVLAVAVLLVLGLGRVLTWSSDASGGEDQATQAAANTSPSADSTKKSGPGKKDGKGKGKGKGKGDRTPTPSPTPSPTPLATPSGPCPDADVLVTPSVPNPVAGGDITILLNLQMRTTEACTWSASSDSLELKITAGPDDIWWSGECPGAIRPQQVVIRRAVATPVAVVWNSKRSDAYCTDRTAWALPGEYLASAAAYEGEPTDVVFKLTAPVAAVITQTAQPTQEPSERGSR